LYVQKQNQSWVAWLYHGKQKTEENKQTVKQTESLAEVKRSFFVCFPWVFCPVDLYRSKLFLSANTFFP
jgi:hypothetical protein